MHDQPVTASENLSRFILDKSYFRSSDLRVKFNAFLPARDGELSVFRIDTLNTGDILELGRTFVAAPRNKTLLGFARLKAEIPIASGLRLDGTEFPHPRHANISNWPGGTEDRLIAMKLAESASLNLAE